MSRNPALERDEDFIASCFEGIHPALKRLHVPDPEPEEESAKCRACGTKLPLSQLTDDLLCKSCDENVRDLEAGKIS